MKIVKKDIGLMWGIFFVYFFVIDAYEALLPLYLKEIGIGASILGGIVFFANLIRILSSVLVAYIGDAKRTIFFTMIILFLSISSLIFLKNGAVIVILSVLILSTKSPFNISANPLLAYSVSSEERGLAFGIRDVFLYAGTSFGLLFSGVLISYGFPLIFVCLSVLMSFSFVFISYLSGGAKNSKNNKYESIFSKINKIKEKKNLFICCVVAFLAAFSSGVMFLIPLKGKSIDISSDFILYSFAGSSIIAALLSYVGGKVTDKFNRRKLFLLNLFLSFILYITIFFSSDLISFSFSVILIGILYVFAPVFPVYFFDLFEQEEGELAWGILATISLIGEMIAPLLWGVLWDNFVQNYVFLLSSVIVLVNLVFSVKALPNK
ncbi:MFS transporter [Bacillus cereus group sp. BfR-BA-01402]|uniref:MFS transporter n=3 Tax=unclassified Bacillus cereus group TaxID=2750818 RepID=UPI001F572241|nr:MFS transporter [Bacillus cereus group sp. BfR-BA-01402]